MFITTKQILVILHVLAWIIFVGLCIDAVGFVFSTVYALAFPSGTLKTYWADVDFNSLYAYDKGHFFVMALYMIIVVFLKAIIFILIIRLFQKKKFNLSSPFNIGVVRFINLVACLSLGIGLFSSMGAKYSRWLSEKGIRMSDIEDMRLGGADVWFFMGVILLIIAQVFKRGIEIQSENDLTI